MRFPARIGLAAALCCTAISASVLSRRAIVTVPRIHHRADVERSGSYHVPPIRKLPHVKWTKDQGTLFMGTPLATHGKVYSGGSDGTLYAFDSQTGEAYWSAPGFDAIENATVIAGDMIVAGGANGAVRALDRRTGNLIWSYDAGAMVVTAPLAVGDLLYIATFRALHALDLKSGQQKWLALVGTTPAFVSSPASHNDVVFFSVGSTLYAFDAGTGKERWHVTSTTQFWSLALGDQLLYIGSSDGYLRAYDQATGRERWRFKSSYPTADEIWSAPAIADGVVYVGSRDRSMYAVDASTGAKKWAFRTTGESVGDPVVAGGILYFSDSNHALPMGPRRLYALDASTGTEVWHYELRSTLLTTPALGEGVIYATITGQVMALTAR